MFISVYKYSETILTKQMNTMSVTVYQSNSMSIKSFDCCEPWYSFIKDGMKVVEGRLCNHKYCDLISGDIIQLNNEDNTDFIILSVITVTKYSSFKCMLEAETIERVLPGILSIEDGVNVYRQFYSQNLEIKKGVIAITVKLVQEQ